MPDHHERLLDLIAFLLSARHPVPVAEIYKAFPSEYGGTEQGRERKFSRDKERLRALGISIVYVANEEDEGEPGGYLIDRAAFFLPDVALTPDERAALFAVGAAALQAALPLRSELSYALTKLRASSVAGEERAQPVILSAGERRSDVEDLITRAVGQHKQLRLRYAGERRERLVDPYAFSVRRNRFSFVGYCHLRRDIRTFHAERVQECHLESDTAGADFDLPAGFDATPHLPVHPWQIRLHAPIAVTLAFPPALAESGPRALGVEPDAATIEATNLDGLLAEVLALGEGIRVVGPASARERLSGMLERLQQRHREVA